MNCKYCNKNHAVIYEDDILYVMLSDEPATIGHLLVVPKKHAPILDVLTNDEIKHVMFIAGKMSEVLFETLKIEGTNILIQNGPDAGQDVPHVCVNVIGRTKEDSLDFEWEGRDIKAEMFAVITKKLGTELGVIKSDTNQSVVDEKEQEEMIKDNYLLKQLRRMP